MNALIEKLKEPEIQELRKRYHEVTGEWLGFHWDCFGSIEEYKEYMRNTINEHMAKWLG